jgi:hypothetical protein
VEHIIFPLDRAWGLTNSVYSRELARHLVWLSGVLPYQQAEEVLRRIGKRTISDSSLWRLTQGYGARLVQADGDAVTSQATTCERDVDYQQVSLDGGFINIRDEGWKEMKVALVGQVGSQLVVNQQTRQVEEQPQTQPLAYRAVLGEVSAFEAVFQRLLVDHQLDHNTQVVVIADGAAWIWRLADTYLPDSLQIVDYYHACQHLAQAAQALFPAQPVEQTTWLQQRRADLWAGHLHPIVQALSDPALAEAKTYFLTHQVRLRYPTFRALALPIGSGAVESEVKQFKARLAGPGMRWSRPAAERMIFIRAAVLDHSFDARWAAAA